MQEEIIERILQRYSRELLALHGMQTGYRNEVYTAELAGHQLVNLILYKREPAIMQRIMNANLFGNFLAERGFPARRTLDDRLIQVRGARTTRYGALYNYLPGSAIPWEAYTMKHLKALGKTLSDMHAALQVLTRHNLPYVHDEYIAIYRRMAEYFKQTGVQDALKAKLKLQAPSGLKVYGDLLKRYKSTGGMQALHMDFVRGNVLFYENTATISGILDFEKAAWGQPVFDVARTLAFLLVDCKYKPGAKIRKYFLASGYNKHGASKLVEAESLESLLDMFLLHDFYKFLRHNPYEALPENEHFVRTRDLLLSREVITAAT